MLIEVHRKSDKRAQQEARARRRAKRCRAAALAAAFAATIVACFLLGRLARPAEDWSRQHTDTDDDPKVFRNSFLGLCMLIPDEDDWRMVSDPSHFRFQGLKGVNKVLEIDRMVGPGESRRQWARMDLFVHPLYGQVEPDHVLRVLEFRPQRPGFRIVDERTVTIGGEEGTARTGAWSLGGRRFRAINYAVSHAERLLCFVAVCEAEAFARHRARFDRIVASVRFE
ncbi:MAG: hypothetical protein ACLF0G_04475 [Candidatus Brocadiia bacterium]